MVSLGHVLEVAYHAGQTRSYKAQLTTTTVVQIPGQPQGQPVSINSAGTYATRVVSVDPSGIATIDVTFSNWTATTNGTPVDVQSKMPQQMEMKIAKDGTLVSMQAGGTSTTGGGTSAGFDEVTPILPDHAVNPGDTWTKTTTTANFFGGSPITVTTKSRYLKNETVGGIQAAVIESKGAFHMDTTFDFSKLMQAMGQPASTPGLAGVSAHIVADLTLRPDGVARHLGQAGAEEPGHQAAVGSESLTGGPSRRPRRVADSR